MFVGGLDNGVPKARESLHRRRRGEEGGVRRGSPPHEFFLNFWLQSGAFSSIPGC